MKNKMWNETSREREKVGDEKEKREKMQQGQSLKSSVNKRIQ